MLEEIALKHDIIEQSILKETLMHVVSHLGKNEVRFIITSPCVIKRLPKNTEAGILQIIKQYMQ